MGGSCAWLTEEEGVFLAFVTYYAKWARPWGGSVQTVLKIGGAIQHLAECLKNSFGGGFHRNSSHFVLPHLDILSFSLPAISPFSVFYPASLTLHFLATLFPDHLTVYFI